jgi:4-carboxymuconolactone decarboxylase
MKKAASLLILFFTLIVNKSIAQETSIFPKGEKAPNVHHLGTVWLNELSKPDSIFPNSISVATFEANSRLNWHLHPGGQILLITEGIGYYQERNKPEQVLKKGDVVKCLPNVEHWHGSLPDAGVTYLAFSPSEKGKTVWLEKVTDDQYSTKNSSLTVQQNKEQEIINLSKKKWLWMADKNIDSLNTLFDEKSVFVHMGGSWGKEQEINIIKSGGIWYKQADIQETSVQIIGNTAILLSKIKLTAIVGGNEVVNPFMVTEVYIEKNNQWSLGSLSFTKLLTP